MGDDTHLNEQSLLYFPEVTSVLWAPCTWDYWGGQKCTGHGAKAGQLPIHWVLSAPQLGKVNTRSSPRVKGHKVSDKLVQGERQVS